MTCPARWPLLLLLLSAGLQAEPRILVHGHRGARAMRPENTLPAFRYAIEQGVDALELDMAVTRDNVLVISHDPLLSEQICDGPVLGIAIRTLTLAELRRYDCGAKKNPRFPMQVPVPGTQIPTLDEVFALAPLGSFAFNIETKSFPDHPEYTPSPKEFDELVLAMVRKNHLESRVILQSFDFRTLREMHSLAPQLRLSALYEKNDKDYVAIAKESGASIVSPDFHTVTPDKVERAHAAGLQVIPWTANLPSDWKRLAEAKVDAIISDDPAALIAWLKLFKTKLN